MLSTQLLSRLRMLASEARLCQVVLHCKALPHIPNQHPPLAADLRLLSTSCSQHAKHRGLSKRKRDLSEKKLTRYFVDHRRVHVVGGAGGKGACCFHSEPRKEYGGPDGGDGGNGGHVILKVDSQVKSLASVVPTYHGDDGESGGSKNCFGKSGENVYIKVPIGTIVKEDGQVIADLSKPGEEFVVAHGGLGGKGNRFFLSNENRSPMTAMPGEPGEERMLQLEVKTMAHAGMVGFPNAGKSSLLRLLSNARPAVAPYPFTTLNPHVGIIEYQDYEQIAVADIPGIIEGAHQNRGLGLSFLKHIERCRFLLFVVDLSHPEPWVQLSCLQYELEQFDEDLAQRPYVVVANKLDLPVAPKTLQLLRQKVRSKVIGVSALTGDNAEELILHVREMYDEYRHKEDKKKTPAHW
ncbi:mitochondrial ribosome-associated GTPase 2 [Bombina bombina]|uniref:mitochondrial ribosome-associated GTPase 2 n=1 Tax=Bombina bombina TaxID=8345 RepID=UPI00235AD3B9|nr:mitochondrial ribosome-associated GTPase 2 [Bombina bombina]XP_053562458.1 mitochondrial ribosome-associated GTPase 2 [Bombina bombina]